MNEVRGKKRGIKFNGDQNYSLVSRLLMLHAEKHGAWDKAAKLYNHTE